MHLTLILTEDCNLRCRYCYVPEYIKNAMTVETAMAAVHRALEGGAERLVVTFFGGEPFLRADTLFDILGRLRHLERTHRISVTANVSTNGILLDEGAIQRAAHLGLFISLSHDGIAPAHDAGRVDSAGAGSFEKTDAALHRLVAARKPFAVYSVVTPENLRYLCESQKHFWRAGARILITAFDYTAEWSASSIGAVRREYKRLGTVYAQRLRERAAFHLEPFDSRIAQRTRARSWKRCSPGVNQLTVAPDGTLYACMEYFYRRQHPLGNVTDGLDAAAVSAMLRERGGRPEECSGCGVRDRCMNTCACVNLRTSGHAAVPGETVCRLEQEALLAVDAVATKLYRSRTPAFFARHYSCSFHLLSGIEAYFDELEADHEHATTR